MTYGRRSVSSQVSHDFISSSESAMQKPPAAFFLVVRYSESKILKVHSFKSGFT